MAELIERASRIEAAGRPAKIIEEFVGRINTASQGVSIARMTSPEGWREPGQRPEFDEYTVVLEGTLHVRSAGQEIDVHAGQAVLVRAGEWVQYSTPAPGGASYMAVCIPAFAPETVHRDPEPGDTDGPVLP